MVLFFWILSYPTVILTDTLCNGFPSNESTYSFLLIHLAKIFLFERKCQVVGIGAATLACISGGGRSQFSISKRQFDSIML